MKWSNLTYKKRSLIVVLTTFIFLFLSILSPIKRTFIAVKSCEDIENKISKAQKAPEQIAQLENAMKEWSNQVIMDVSSDKLQVKIFEEVGKICEGEKVMLKSLVLLSEQSLDDFNIQSFDVVLESNYSTLLKALHHIEYQMKYGRVVSVKFFKSKAKRNKNEILQAQVLVQGVSKI